jgi:hypothetical protein
MIGIRISCLNRIGYLYEWGQCVLYEWDWDILYDGDWHVCLSGVGRKAAWLGTLH